MAHKRKFSSMEDGDSAHWVKSRTKKISAQSEKIRTGKGSSGRTGKYVGKRKASRKR